MFTMIYVLLAKIGQAQLSLSGRMPSSMKDLTPELVKEWERKLHLAMSSQPDSAAVSSYHIEKRISDLEASLESAGGVVKGIVQKKLDLAYKALEEFSPPVPVEPSTFPKYIGVYTDYSGIDLQALEIALDYLNRRIDAGMSLIAKTIKHYKTRGALYSAGLWTEGKALNCPPKGTIGKWFKGNGTSAFPGLTALKKERRSVLLAIEVAERLADDNAEVPDVVTQWNTSGIPGPGGDSQGEDLRRYPILQPALSKDDLAEMVRPVSERSAEQERLLAWVARLDGYRFTDDFQTSEEIPF